MKSGDKVLVIQNLSGASSPEKKGKLAKRGEVLTIVDVNDKKSWYDEKNNPYTGEVTFYCADNYLQYLPVKDVQLV